MICWPNSFILCVQPKAFFKSCCSVIHDNKMDEQTSVRLLKYQLLLINYIIFTWVFVYLIAFASAGDPVSIDLRLYLSIYIHTFPVYSAM